jgi:hypothetical protein
MSFAGHAANLSGCVVRPKGRATGLIGFADKTQRYSLIGSSAMEAAEHREPCESRGSCTDLGAPGGEIPPGDSTSTAASIIEPRGSYTPHNGRDGGCSARRKRAIIGLMQCNMNGAARNERPPRVGLSEIQSVFGTGGRDRGNVLALAVL